MLAVAVTPASRNMPSVWAANSLRWVSQTALRPPFSQPDSSSSAMRVFPPPVGSWSKILATGVPASALWICTSKSC